MKINRIAVVLTILFAEGLLTSCQEPPQPPPQIKAVDSGEGILRNLFTITHLLI